MAVGLVWLVGAGPGDSGLVTVKALDCIRQADVLVYDRLVSPQLVAQARPGAELIYVGKETGRHGRKQADINQLLADLALTGKRVCRLKGGDPFVFGRGAEEAEALVEAGVPFEVVPGLTSGLAAAAYAGISVTHRDMSGSVTLVTGHDAPGKAGPAVDWERQQGTLVIYMGVSGLAATAARLIAAGRAPETPVAVIRWGTTAQQATVTGTLATIAGVVERAGIESPAVAVVGDVVSLRSRLNWAEGKPLFGRRVIVPEVTPGHPAAAALRDAGAEVWEWPVATLREVRVELDVADAVLFASPEAVRRVIRGLIPAGRDLTWLLGRTLGAADAETAAALADAGLRAGEVVPGPGVAVAGAPDEVEPLLAPGAVALTTHDYDLRMDLLPLLRTALAEAELLPPGDLERRLVERLLGSCVSC